MYSNVLPPLIEIPIQKEIASYEKKCLIHERLLYQYLKKKINGWSVTDFFKAEKIKKYALYAVTDFTILFYEDLEKSTEQYRLRAICDKKAERFRLQFETQSVITPVELLEQYQNKKIDKIVVMSVLHEKEIFDELLKKEILLNDIISFVSVLYS